MAASQHGRSTTKTVALIVAHPDDETLWAGGTILSHPSWKCFIVCLCRGSDTERASKFYETLKILQAEGTMGDLNDGPEQHPLDENELEKTILKLLPSTSFDLIITHNATGEYTKHLRHEETNKAVISLWHSGKISAKELWTFAYEDGNKNYLPKAIQRASIYLTLPKKIWIKKYNIITETYGFEENSWEARTTPLSEAFWSYKIHSSERFDLLGNCLAILSGIASPTRADDMISWIEEECTAMHQKGELAVNLPPNFFPYINPEDPDWHPRYASYNNPGEYHNGGIWSFIEGLYVAALVAANRFSLAEEKLVALTHCIKTPRAESVDFGFNEWIKAQDGKPMGQDWQTWSAALYLYAAKCVEEKRTPFFDEIRNTPVEQKKELTSIVVK